MTTRIDAQFADALNTLETVRRELAADISTYPTPISGCDAQFNHLLARRTQIARAIEALQAEVFIPTLRSPSPLAGFESR